ncbi:ISL3 family transposase [Kitasatospora sp. NPDC059646]|uniref:ISL3 family transposase n=1 Tax=Kitasatospora sp. NPDC059646 TaxID=3346893 RepID=UPI003699B8A3
MSVADLLAVLFPQFALLSVDLIRPVGRSVRVHARGRAPGAECPGCGRWSGRVHSGYERRVSDTAVSGQELLLHLRVRRFFCDTAGCGKRTFAEQIPGLTFRYGRCTVPLRKVREAVALALGGRAGARLAERLSAGIGRDALIRLIRALPDPADRRVRVLGVDDFALRKGHNYGTVLIDIEGRRPVEVLPERSADALAQWLTEHPGVEVICRDRAAYYAEGATRGAGTATQVADRYHLWANLGVAAERLVARLRSQWVPPTPDREKVELPEGPRARRTRERHAAVHALMDRGMGHSQIVAELQLDPKTVRKFMRAAHPGRADRRGTLGRPADQPGRPRRLPDRAVQRRLPQRTAAPPRTRRTRTGRQRAHDTTLRVPAARERQADHPPASPEGPRGDRAHPHPP